MSPSEWLCSRHLLENSNLSRWKLLPAKANLRHLISEKSHRKLKFVSSLSCWVMSDSFRPSKLQPTRYLYPWDFLGKNTGVGYHFLLQGISLGQGLNLRPLHWQADSLPRSHQGSPMPKFTNNLIGFFFSMSFLLQEVRTLDYNEHRLYCNLVKAILQATKVILCGVPSFILTRRMHVFKTIFNCIVYSVTQDLLNLPHLNSITGKILPNKPEYLLSESRRNINQCLSLFPW